MITEIRTLTGLSHEKLGDLLGVSRSMVEAAEKYRRSLAGAASHKLTMLALTVQQLIDAQETMPAVPATCSRPEKFAVLHKKKMDDHLYLAEGLRLKLNPLLKRYRQLVNSLVLLNAMMQINGELYRSTAADKKIAGQLLDENEDALEKLVESIELLQDKLELHLGYAEVHKQYCDKFEGMKKQQK